ncbi:hypothetical protein [Bhargavaea ginsengi]|uniref:hypothetical protein n=1 Tax=Bhargavaea ginsengi TaxID=426757 RepID=UPI00115FF37C|nr:hypothetical protein [Bhargavaea ginsengi]
MLHWKCTLTADWRRKSHGFYNDAFSDFSGAACGCLLLFLHSPLKFVIRPSYFVINEKLSANVETGGVNDETEPMNDETAPCLVGLLTLGWSVASGADDHMKKAMPRGHRFFICRLERDDCPFNGLSAV